MAGLRYATLAEKVMRTMTQEFPALSDPDRRLAFADAVSAVYDPSAPSASNERAVREAVRGLLLGDERVADTPDGRGELYVVNVLRMDRGLVLSSVPYFVSVPDGLAVADVESAVLAEDAESGAPRAGASTCCLSVSAGFDDLDDTSVVAFYERDGDGIVEKGRIAAGLLRKNVDRAAEN